jgi:hypothetical protein
MHCHTDYQSRDIEALTHGAKYIQCLIPAVVNVVYKKLLQYDITARAFSTNTTTSSSPIDLTLSEPPPPQILQRKMLLRSYLTKERSDPTHMSF